MKHRGWIGLAIGILVVAVTACGGGDGGTEPPPTSPPVPTEPLPTQPPEPPAEGLDVTQEPNFGQVDLTSGFTPDPYEVELISGGTVDVAALNLGSGCAGYATSAPDFRLMWSGESDGVRIFFVPDEEGEDATLIVNDPTASWSCNDDYSERNPLVEIDDPPAGQYDIWVGSYSASDFIAGTLYITELDLGPEDYVGTGEMIRQWASSATASSEYSNPDWSAMQATGAPDTDECGDIDTAWASAQADSVEWLELTYDVAVIPSQINIYETHSPGFIVEVEVIDENGEYYVIWEGGPDPDAACPRVFTLDVSGVDFPIVGMRLNLDQSQGGSWNEIDAVELVGFQP